MRLANMTWPQAEKYFKENDIILLSVEIPVPRPVIDFTDNGWVGADHPKYATPEWGHAMLNACADFIADFLDAFRRVPLPETQPAQSDRA